MKEAHISSKTATDAQENQKPYVYNVQLYLSANTHKGRQFNYGSGTPD
jgi:hypothetical protein